MKASKKVYSEAFKEYRLSKEELSQLQETLLGMLIDIKKVCDENRISYMLSGGTLLGAIRHQGFIPWDDDVDIMMLRNEYLRFRRVFEKAFSGTYVISEPLSSEHHISKMVKIYKKGTEYIEIPTAGIDGNDMVFVDLFIIENVPKPGIVRSMKSKIYDIAFKGSSTCVDYLYPSPVILEKAKYNAEVKKYYSFRRRVGWFFSHVGGSRFYLRICEKLANQQKRTGWLGIPSGISYEREIMPATVYEDTLETDFCGYKMRIPRQYSVYLENLYGDYMKVPPKEDREVHAAYRIKL